MSQTSQIGMRIDPNEKEKWEKFVIDSNGKFKKLSQLIRYVVNSYIMGDLVESSSNNQSNPKFQELAELKLKYESELKDLNVKKAEMENFLRNLKISDSGKKEESLRGRILTTLKKAPYTSEELANILEIDEGNIIEQLSFCFKSGLLEINGNNEYCLKEA